MGRIDAYPSPGTPITAGMIVSEAWTSYTATVTQGVTVTMSFATARYYRIGRLIVASYSGTCNSTGTAGTQITVALPAPIANPAGYYGHPLGSGYIYDSSTTSIHCAIVTSGGGSMSFLSTSAVTPGYLGVNGFTAALTSPDHIVFNLSYQSST